MIDFAKRATTAVSTTISYKEVKLNLVEHYAGGDEINVVGILYFMEQQTREKSRSAAKLILIFKRWRVFAE